jgi:hypothetical protein
MYDNNQRISVYNWHMLEVTPKRSKATEYQVFAIGNPFVIAWDADTCNNRETPNAHNRQAWDNSK